MFVGSRMRRIISFVLVSMFCVALVAATDVSPTLDANDISDENAMLSIRTYLDDNGLLNVTTQIDDTQNDGEAKSLVMGYQSTAITPESLTQETGIILGAFLGAVKSGWDCEELVVTIRDVNGVGVGEWYCSKEWTEAYICGEMSLEELLLKVLNTMDTIDA